MRAFDLCQKSRCQNQQASKPNNGARGSLELLRIRSCLPTDLGVCFHNQFVPGHRSFRQLDRKVAGLFVTRVHSRGTSCVPLVLTIVTRGLVPILLESAILNRTRGSLLLRVFSLPSKKFLGFLSANEQGYSAS